MKKVSIVLASYNGERFIKQQIQSIISQMNRQDELIISDDGSTDETVNIIKKFVDYRIKLTNGPQKGVIKNFEHAIQQTSGQIIVMADQDDIWLDNRLKNIRKYFSGTTNKMAVYQSQLKFIDAKKNVVFASPMKPVSGIVRNVIRNRYIGAMMAFSSSLKDYILPFPENIAMHDQWIGLVNEILKGEFKISNEPEVLYRRHGQNLTGETKKLTIIKKVINRLYMSYYLLKKYLYVKRRKL